MTDAGSTPSSGPGDEETATGEVDDGTLDRTFDLLAGQRRRYVLEKLRATPDGVASVDDLADHLLERAPDATDGRRVQVGLHHRTLPKLDHANVIDFDPRSDVVRYHGTEIVENLLDGTAPKPEESR